MQKWPDRRDKRCSRIIVYSVGVLAGAVLLCAILWPAQWYLAEVLSSVPRGILQIVDGPANGSSTHETPSPAYQAPPQASGDSTRQESAGTGSQGESVTTEEHDDPPSKENAPKENVEDPPPKENVQDLPDGVAVDPAYRARRPVDVDQSNVDETKHALDSAGIHRLVDRDDYIMVTWANAHYFDFVKNWVEHVEALGISSFVVGAMDQEILINLLQAGIPCFAMQSGLSADDFGWGTKAFHTMGRKKIKLVQLFTEMNVTVIISDVDTVWMRNPFVYFKNYSEADILTSSDALAWTHRDEGLEDFRKAGAAYNIGIMMFSPKSVDFAREWVDVIEKDDKIWDQNAFNDLVRRGGMRAFPADDPRHAKRLFLGNGGTLTCGVLPVSIFCSGHTFFVTRMHEELQLEPYVVHATFQYSGTKGKRNRLRERMLWNDPPEYYDPPFGLVTWQMDVPEDLLANAAPPSGMDHLSLMRCCEPQAGHFRLMNHQLRQTRQALAIASVLGRGIIVPQFVAGQDRWWAPHAGTLPGAPTKLPYRAPLDHVIDLERGLGKNRSEAEFGPNIAFREYSFLDNPRMPEHVKQSVLRIEVCPEGKGSEGCSDGSGAAVVEDGRVRLQRGLNDKQLVAALGHLSEHRVLQFVGVGDAFSRHEDEGDHKRFMKRTTQMNTIWCCVLPAPGKPGHVWYDLWWDAVPHRDLHNRLWNEEWKITTGP